MHTPRTQQRANFGPTGTAVAAGARRAGYRIDRLRASVDSRFDGGARDAEAGADLTAAFFRRAALQ
jgi:hypothetical protein